MYKLKVNENQEFSIDKKEILAEDIVCWKKGHYHLILNDKNYDIEILSFDNTTKLMTLKLNEKVYEVSIKDKHDLLLAQLGMDNPDSGKISEIKAPMPGLVTKLIAQKGDELEKGKAVLVLEAMKMENVLKSPGTGKIKSFSVKQGDAVEKNQVLVVLE
ncbi:MAG: acetyl-CoA carboxylase biotin carboxyl carrier protein subunit [Chitinophagaceae bacterium]|nr:MAG: acetyl-CoA carboxylase biotin carboxyl carrier protein subunit [Chitinophagaceae bacterium]